MENNPVPEETISLFEALAKSNYQIQTTLPNDTTCDRPIAYGSGFMIRYKDVTFFVTADHNIHPEDHKQDKRIDVDNVVCIYNNVSDKATISTVLTRVGGFHYAERLDILRGNNVYLVDVTVAILNKETHFQHPFLTDECRMNGRTLVKAGERKFIFNENQLTSANTDDDYFIYGLVKPRMKGVHLHRDSTLKENLKFISKAGDYDLFNTRELIEDEKDWAGLSGSPVLNQKAECVGVLCSVNEDSHSFFVKPISTVKLLMDAALKEEQIAQLGKASEHTDRKS